MVSGPSLHPVLQGTGKDKLFTMRPQSSLSPSPYLPSGLERSLLPIICPQGSGGLGQTRGVERELLVNKPQVCLAGPGHRGAKEEFETAISPSDFRPVARPVSGLACFPHTSWSKASLQVKGIDRFHVKGTRGCKHERLNRNGSNQHGPRLRCLWRLD